MDGGSFLHNFKTKWQPLIHLDLHMVYQSLFLGILILPFHRLSQKPHWDSTREQRAGTIKQLFELVGTATKLGAPSPQFQISMKSRQLPFSIKEVSNGILYVFSKQVCFKFLHSETAVYSQTAEMVLTFFNSVLYTDD